MMIKSPAGGGTVNWADVFTVRLPHVYFVYGLAFFLLGFAVALEIGRSQLSGFSRAVWLLAFFGLIHGSHEWITMFAIIGQAMYGFQPDAVFQSLLLGSLAFSFILLVIFGTELLHPFKQQAYLNMVLPAGLVVLCGSGLLWLTVWLSGQPAAWFAAADALIRYTLAIPGAVLAGLGLLARRRSLVSISQPAYAKDMLGMAIAFIVYGLIGQSFVGESLLFPTYIVNAVTFQNWVGIPIQLFRAIVAVFLAFFTVRALRAFEFRRQQALVEAQQQVQQEIDRQNEMRQEFLHRVVETQEEERTRIARELHDELGQMLTGLAIGLRGTQESLKNPLLLQTQLIQLEETATEALGNMRLLVNELRPALLDDIGLSAAVRHHVNNFSKLTGIQTAFEISQTDNRLPPNLETILFRITQEALTNVARHAQATQVWVKLWRQPPHIVLEIKDNGVGFEPVPVIAQNNRTGWGLIGIQERVSLVKGDLQIQSRIGDGTTLFVRVPINNGGNE